MYNSGRLLHVHRVLLRVLTPDASTARVASSGGWWPGVNTRLKKTPRILRTVMYVLGARGPRFADYHLKKQKKESPK